MTAKEKHKLKLLEFLAEPANDFPSRQAMASQVLGISTQTFYEHFTPDEIAEIESEGLAFRRKKYAPRLAKVDKALLSKAEDGDAQAVKLAYQRFEGWSEKQQHEHSGGLSLNLDYRRTRGGS